MTPRALLVVVVCLAWFAVCVFASLTMQAAEKWMAKNKDSNKARPWYVRFWAWALELDQ